MSRPAGDTMPDRIKVGVVGCRVGRSWVAGARAGEDTIAWAVADLNQELARRVAHENDVPRIYWDYRELLADDEVDAVGIATAPDVRKPMVIDALNAGKHVLVQKPHGRSAADVREINAVAAECGKTLVYSYFMRHEEENKRSRHLIADGRIGRPYHARVHYHYRERGVDFEPPPGREWLYRWGLKGGALGQHGSHFLDQAWYLLGCPQPEWAFAASHSAFPTTLEVARHSEDYMSLMVGCAGGMSRSRWTRRRSYPPGRTGRGTCGCAFWAQQGPLNLSLSRRRMEGCEQARAGCWMASTLKATVSSTST